jgi:prepilin-type N-terminal cleavage/methylation domain-containing protein
MTRLGGRQARGFSLIETIVAAVILGGAVVSIGSISSRALVATRLNRQYETAASIIDRQMAVIQFAGVDQLVTAGQMEGRVDDIPPGYQWAASAAYEGIDALYTVTVTVQWADQGKGYTLSADTQMNGPSTITTNDTSQTTTQGTTSGTSTQAAGAASQ